MAISRAPTTAFALARIAFGAGLIVAPQRVAAGWLAGDAKRPPTQVAVRGLGARDVALAAGLVVDARRRPWLAACALTASMARSRNSRRRAFHVCSFTFAGLFGSIARRA